MELKGGGMRIKKNEKEIKYKVKKKKNFRKLNAKLKNPI